MKIKNRFDRVLKMLTVFAMTLSCFTDMPIRVVAESFDVDSVISIESHNNGTDANDSEKRAYALEFKQYLIDHRGEQETIDENGQPMTVPVLGLE